MSREVVPEFVLQAIGRRHARPRVVRLYRGPRQGWVRAQPRRVLTASVARQLRAQGVAMVVVRAYWRAYEVSLAEYEDHLDRHRRSTWLPVEVTAVPA